MTKPVVSSKTFVLISKLTYQELLNFQEISKTDKESILAQSGGKNQANLVANLNLASRVPKTEITGLSKDEKTVLPSNSSTPALINIESVVDQLVSSGLSGGKLERARTILKLLNQSIKISVNF